MQTENIGNNNIYSGSGIDLPKQNNYETAYNEAVCELLKRDIADVADKSGARIIHNESSLKLILSFLNDEIVITYPNVSLYYDNKNTVLSLWYKILILHYLVQAKGTSLTGNQITFKQIPGGLAYYSAFHKRTIEPLVKSFGKNLNLYIKATEKIGGVKSDISEFSVLFQVFPNVSLVLNLWEGDDDLPSDGNIIFDSSIIDYLTTEDITVLCNIITLLIIKSNSGV